jgi:ABC-type sugar transport system ATPase subunit
VESGAIKVKGELVNLRSPVDAVKQKIAFLPEDRKSMALFLNRSVVVNTSIVFLTKFIGRVRGLLNFVAEEKAVRVVTDSLKLKSSGPMQLLRQLSGGNQQKVVVARWLCGEPMLILADEPTTGVDVGAKIEMLKEFREIAKRGSAILIVSSDFSELVSSCDRILVMKSGQIVNEFAVPFSEQSVLAACFGNAA